MESSCEAGAELYKEYTDLCVKDGALADGRIAFEQGKVCLQGDVSRGCGGDGHMILL